MSFNDRQPRILIADDDDVMLIGVAELLRRRGYEVEATDRLELSNGSGPFDLIIFDPLVEGDLDAARQFVASARQSNPPPFLIVVSEFIESLRDVGARDERRALLHVKPVRVAELAESVESLLREREMSEVLTIIEGDTA
ncbi:MAG: response regulator [Acidobacteria bacterium]|nr:response regulator [Acidobacteriota bacterium]